MPKINFEALQEDLRKIALALLIAALAAVLLKTDNTDHWHAIITAMIGIILWFIGLIDFQKKGEQHD